MDFNKVAEFLDDNIALDMGTATDEELRVNYDKGDDEAWFTIAPFKFQDEKSLAAIINAKAAIKLQSK